MKENEVSDVIFSDYGQYGYVIFMHTKEYDKSEIDYQAQKEQRAPGSGTTLSSYYLNDKVNSLNVRDWRNEASITATVDPDSRETKNLSDLYFDINSYLQLRNILISR